MPQVYASLEAPPAWAAGQATHDVSWERLAFAAITSGRVSDPTAQFPWLPGADPHLVFFDAIHRAGAMRAYLTEHSQRFVKSTLYPDLERSEKMLVSFYVGMTSASLFADLHLDVGELVHLDRLCAIHNIALAGTRSPDFLGHHPTHGWIVVEAKGRSSGRGHDAYERMREQKDAVATVDGHVPALKFGLMAAYTRNLGNGVYGLAWRAIDPPERVDIRITPDQLFATYFGLFATLADAAPTEFEDNRTIIVLPGADVVLRVPTALLLGVRELDPRASGWAANVRKSYPPAAAGALPGDIQISLGSTWLLARETRADRRGPDPGESPR